MEKIYGLLLEKTNLEDDTLVHFKINTVVSGFIKSDEELIDITQKDDNGKSYIPPIDEQTAEEIVFQTTEGIEYTLVNYYGHYSDAKVVGFIKTLDEIKDFVDNPEDYPNDEDLVSEYYHKFMQTVIIGHYDLNIEDNHLFNIMAIDANNLHPLTKENNIYYDDLSKIESKHDKAVSELKDRVSNLYKGIKSSTTKEDLEFNSKKLALCLHTMTKSLNEYLKMLEHDEELERIIREIKKTSSIVRKFYDSVRRQEKMSSEDIRLSIRNFGMQYDQNIINVMEAIKALDTYKVRKDTYNTFARSEEKKELKSFDFDAKELKKYLDYHVVGQSNAKKIIVNALKSRSLNPLDKRTLLFVGGTGTGKTFLVEKASEFLNIPSIKINSTNVTAAGYHGDDIEDHLRRLLIAANGDVEKAEHGFVIFDEIDKKGSKANDDVAGRAVLNSLLGFIQGSVCLVPYNGKTIPFDTSNLNIAMTGAFANVVKELLAKNKVSPIGFNAKTDDNSKSKVVLDDDNIVEYGDIPEEFVGRVEVVPLDNHTVDSLKEILLYTPSSACLIKYNTFKNSNITLRYEEGLIEAIASDAVKKGSGARGLNKTVNHLLDPMSNEVLLHPELYSEVIVTEESATDPNKMILILKDGTERLLGEVLEERKAEEEAIKREREPQFSIIKKRCERNG